MKIRVYVMSTNGERTATADVTTAYDPLIGIEQMVVRSYSLHGMGGVVCRFCSQVIKAGQPHKTRLNGANPVHMVLEVSCIPCYQKDFRQKRPKPLTPLYDPRLQRPKYPSTFDKLR